MVDLPFVRNPAQGGPQSLRSQGAEAREPPCKNRARLPARSGAARQ